MKLPKTQTKQPPKYMMKALLPECMCNVLYHMIKDCVPEDANPALVPRYMEETAVIVDSLFGYISSDKRYQRKTKGWYTITSKLGRKFAPLVFGRTHVRIEGKIHYVGARFSEKESKIERMLDILKEKGLIQVKYAIRSQKQATRFRLAKGVYIEFKKQLRKIKQEDAPRFLTLSDYVRLRYGIEKKTVGKTVEQLIFELPTSKTAIRTEAKRLSSCINVESRNDVGDDGKRATSKYKEMFNKQDFIPLDFSSVEVYLQDMLNQIFDTHLIDADAKEQTRIRSYHRRASKKIAQGKSITTAYNESSKEGTGIKDIADDISRRLAKYLSVLNSLTRILTSGRVYYDRKTDLVMYKPEYTVNAQGGRSYENGGGFQNLSREVKELIAGELVDNYDIIHCHLTIVQKLMVIHNLEHLSPLLASVEDVANDLSGKFIEKAKNFSYLYEPGTGKHREVTKQLHEEATIKLSFTSFARLFRDSTSIGKLTKTLLYATLNNGSDRLAVGPKSDTGGQIIDIATLNAESFKYAKMFQRFVSECWNEFCAEQGIHAVFAALTEIYIEQSSMYGGELLVKNSFGNTVRYGLKETVKTSISRKDRKRVLNHIVTGHEVCMIYSFLKENGMPVFCFEHDGLVVPKGSTINSATINEYFKLKSFS